MRDFSGKVAVVTGAASGIGFALAKRFARGGMKIVLADVEVPALDRAAAEIRSLGADTVSVVCDVAKEDDVIRLASHAFAAWGRVHVLCNNAGVGGAPKDAVWQTPQPVWDWVMGVNFQGVLYGIRHFLPRMIEAGEEGHVVNTASAAGFVVGVTSVPYTISKHAVVALTESLYKDLRACESRISASVLCPGFVKTRIADSDRNLPDTLRAASPPGGTLSADAEAHRALVRQLLEAGYEPDAIADRVWDAIGADTFYVVPVQDYIGESIATRLGDIGARRNPTLSRPA